MLVILRRAIDIFKSDGFSGLISGVARFFRYGFFWKNTDYLNKLIFEFKNGRGISVMNEDWDNLIILDACRFDIFEQYSDFNPCKLEKVISKGSWSPEFIRSNFNKSKFHDTVYVTANAHAEKVDDGTFFKLVKLYRLDNGRSPEVVTQAALKTSKKYPNKRLIVHYMQPHTPHLGPTAHDIDGRIFKAAANNIITDETLTKSYIENFLLVQEYVKRLLQNIEGKSIITSDHGENLGELGRSLRRDRFNKPDFRKKRLFSHGHQTPECRYVPWCEIIQNNRRIIAPSEPIPPIKVDDTLVENQLKDLGYL